MSARRFRPLRSKKHSTHALTSAAASPLASDFVREFGENRYLDAGNNKYV